MDDDKEDKNFGNKTLHSYSSDSDRLKNRVALPSFLVNIIFCYLVLPQ